MGVRLQLLSGLLPALGNLINVRPSPSCLWDERRRRDTCIGLEQPQQSLASGLWPVGAPPSRVWSGTGKHSCASTASGRLPRLKAKISSALFLFGARTRRCFRQALQLSEESQRSALSFRRASRHRVSISAGTLTK